MSPDKHHPVDELPELPPLDDDGDAFGGDDDDLLPSGPEHDRDLDDATGESEENDRFGALETNIDEEGGLLEGSDASEDLVVDADRELLAGAEVGLLVDSDEGDGRDVTGEEADLLVDSERSEEDGGAEGTDEDPSAVLDAGLDRPRVASDDPLDDEGFDDLARFQDAAPRDTIDREPWPPRADVPWSVGAATPIEADPVTSAGALVVAVQGGALVVSTDGGNAFTRVRGCNGVTALTILSAKKPSRAVLAALWDATREASGVVLVRIDDAGALSPELVADFLPNADDPDEEVSTKIASLRARPDDAPREALVTFERGGCTIRPKS